MAVAAPAAFGVSGALFEDVPHNNIRKIIAKRLTDSKRDVPHYYLATECVLDELVRLRANANASLEKADKLSVNDFIIKASAKALVDVPQANSAWFDDFVRTYKHADVCVAVSTDKGLITPIIAKAELKTLSQISAETKELAGRARANKLKPEEFMGGTFTVSNLGMFGVKNFTAIINPPQACILAVGGMEKKVVSDGKGGFKEVSVMIVSLSADHRVIDGAVGAQWLAAFKKYIENPVLMLV
ncbi:2-oxoacid dehydrogenase acyltransferase [Pavlovales sp. CCMP2436]|nr:2-oxoacid dehydrogenase acyltransferase [Pavlovales sp. CCMP2436]